MRKIAALIFTSLVFLSAELSAQVIFVLDNFNTGTTSGSVIASSTWNHNVNLNGSTLAVSGSANDDQGWAASNVTISASGTLVFQVAAQLASTNVVPFLALQLTDANSRTAVAFLSTSQFNTSSLTTGTSGAFTFGFGPFDFTHITDWSFGGGGTGATAGNFLNMTFDNLTLAVPEPSTYTLLALGLGVILLPVLRRRR